MRAAKVRCRQLSRTPLCVNMRGKRCDVALPATEACSAELRTREDLLRQLSNVFDDMDHLDIDSNGTIGRDCDRNNIS